jgi:hypothetical protein
VDRWFGAARHCRQLQARRGGGVRSGVLAVQGVRGRCPVVSIARWPLWVVSETWARRWAPIMGVSTATRRWGAS